MKNINELIELLCELYSYPGVVNLQYQPYVRFKNDLTEFIYSNKLQYTKEWKTIKSNLVVNSRQYMSEPEADIILINLQMLQESILRESKNIKNYSNELPRNSSLDVKYSGVITALNSIQPKLNQVGNRNYNIMQDNSKIEAIENSNINDFDKIFISHRSSDKKYGNAISELLRDLGLRNDQIIYTSHPLHKIPNNKNIYEFLKDNISDKIYCLFVLSKEYFNSSICLNEMGAFWVTKSKCQLSFVPDFDFNNDNFKNCVLDGNKIGFIYDVDEMSIASVIEFKNDIVANFNLRSLTEQEWEYVLTKYKNAIDG